MAARAIVVEPVESIPETSAAERVVGDVQAIGASAADAERVRDSVPLWFHTFALAPGIYTPGIARDHGYRLAVLGPDRFAGRSVLDVGAFDGFYSFLAEVRGARRVVAVDNDQYVDWVRARFGVSLQDGVSFRAIAGLVGSRVEYRHMDALDVRELGERFDVVLCFGILHRVTNPIALLRALTGVLAPGRDRARDLRLAPGRRRRGDRGSRAGRLCTRAMNSSTGASRRRVCGNWGRSSASTSSRSVDELEVDGHPRILALLRAAADRALALAAQAARDMAASWWCSPAGRSVVIASTPRAAARAAGAASLTVPVVTLRPPSRRRSTSSGCRRKCSMQTPPTPASAAHRASAAGA